MNRIAQFIAITVVAGTLAGCGSSSQPSAAGRQVALGLATLPGAAAPVSAMSAVGSQTFTDAANDTLVITSVQLVLRKIEFKRVSAAVCDTLATTHDGCEELKAGPILLALPLTGGAAQQFTVVIDTGTYSKVEFKIHRPTSSHDAAFIAQNPGFDSVSIKVAGTFNGTAFAFQSDLDVDQESDLVPPLTVTDQTGANLTLMVDLSTWFLNGPNLVDPASANQSGVNEGLVKNNIEASFHAFEDANHDGRDDHAVI